MWGLPICHQWLAANSIRVLELLTTLSMNNENRCFLGWTADANVDSSNHLSLWYGSESLRHWNGFLYFFTSKFFFSIFIIYKKIFSIFAIRSSNLFIIFIDGPERLLDCRLRRMLFLHLHRLIKTLTITLSQGFPLFDSHRFGPVGMIMLGFPHKTWCWPLAKFIYNFSHLPFCNLPISPSAYSM